MCGISGFIGSKKINDNIIKSTLKMMKNRGPDKQDFYYNSLNRKNKVYLLHSRLSIIDLKNRSHQPFRLGNLILIFNGEIYNYLELKKKN